MRPATTRALAIAATLALVQTTAWAQVRPLPAFSFVRSLPTPLLSEPGRPSSDLNIFGSVAYTRSDSRGMQVEGWYSQGTSDFPFAFYSQYTLTPGCAGMPTVTITGSRAGRMSPVGTYATTAFLARSPSNNSPQLGLVLAGDTVVSVLCPAFAGSGVFTEAVAINAYQLVVGTTRLDRTTVATRWMSNWGGSSVGVPLDLSAVAGATAGGAFPAAINRWGTVVGTGLPSFASPSQGVWMKREGAPAVMLFEPSTQRPVAAGVNDRGAVVGTIGSSAWVFEVDVGSGLFILPKLPGGSVAQAFAINNNDTIVGSCDGRACYWKVESCVTPGPTAARRCTWGTPRLVGTASFGTAFRQAVAISDTDASNPLEHMLVEGSINGGSELRTWLVRKNFD